MEKPDRCAPWRTISGDLYKSVNMSTFPQRHFHRESGLSILQRLAWKLDVVSDVAPRMEIGRGNISQSDCDFHRESGCAPLGPANSKLAWLPFNRDSMQRHELGLSP